MSRLFQTFIDRLHQAGGRDDLRDALTGFVRHWGIDSFTYLGFPPPGPGEPVWVTTYPAEWARHYERSSYHLIDPVVRDMHAGVMPFFWNSVSPANDATRAQRRLFAEASDVGLNSGLTVPIHDGRGGVAAVTFASAQMPKALIRELKEERSTIHLAALYFHVHARQKLEAPLDLELPHLSPREIACLQWLALGKTMWDVSEILGISRRTVVFHLDNARRKLNAVTLPQAVAIALARRMIEL